jgi:hypothetical protein
MNVSAKSKFHGASTPCRRADWAEQHQPAWLPSCPDHVFRHLWDPDLGEEAFPLSTIGKNSLAEP